MPPEDQLYGYIDRLDRESYTVFILPSLPCDLKIIMYNSECKRVPATWGATLAAAGFLVCFRGLPLPEVDVEIDGKNSRVHFSDLDGKMSIPLPKCKQILEKTHIFGGNVEKSVKLLSIKLMSIRLAAAETNDIELFDNAHLYGLLLADGGADIALCYSVGDDGVKTKSLAPAPIPDMALLSALAAFECIGDRKAQTFINDGELLTLKKTYDGVRVSLPPPKFMRFETPYL